MPGRRPTSTPVAVGLLLAALAACGSDSTSTPAAQPPTDAATSPTEDVTTTAGPREIQAPAELPRGGRELFPRYRLVGYSGGPASAAFGRLGIGDLDERVAELEKRAQPYAAGGRQVQPVLELIATVANSSAGSDGMYRTRASDATVRRYLRAARRHKALLLLGIQPGRATFLPEVKAYEKWLREPDVGLALDPEWAVGRSEVPGSTYGTVSGRELDGVAAYVDTVVTERGLPQKAVVFHQVAPSVITGEQALTERPGVALVKSVDGIGSRRLKLGTWGRLTADLSPAVHPGFKVFYVEDARGGNRVMTPAQVLALEPEPEYVMYE